MKTISFKLRNLSEDDKDFILDLQKKRSVAYIKIYNNMELMQDKEFKDYIINNYIFSKRAYEYICTDVEGKYEANQSILNNKIKQIESLREDLKSSIISRRDKRKIQKDLSNLHKQTSRKGITFGGKANLKNISKYCRLYKETNDPKYLELYNKYKKIYRDNRILPLVLFGEANRLGNRFFNFSKISEGEVIFKYEKLKRKVNLNFNINKGYINLLNKLQELCINIIC